MTITSVQYGSNTVQIDHFARRVTTTLPDESKVIAGPEDGDAYRARATALGYIGPNAAWEMCMDHALTHTQLAVAIGLEFSPALRHAAHPDEEWNEGLVGFEERVVLLLQREGWRGSELPLPLS